MAIPFADLTLRVDPATGEVEASVPASPDPFPSPTGTGPSGRRGGSPYQGGFTGAGGVNRIDPDTNACDEESARPPSGLLPGRGGRRVRVDGGPDEGHRLQGRSGRAGCGDRADRPRRCDRVVQRRSGLGSKLGRRHGRGDRGPHRRSSDVPLRASGPRSRRGLRGRAGHPGAGANVRGSDRRPPGRGGEVRRSVRRTRDPGPRDPGRRSGVLDGVGDLRQAPDSPGCFRGRRVQRPTGDRRLDTRRLEGRPDVHLHGPIRLSILSTVERTGDRGDLPVLDRTSPLSGAQRVRAIPHRGDRGRGCLPRWGVGAHLRPSGRRRHAHDRTDGAGP